MNSHPILLQPACSTRGCAASLLSLRHFTTRCAWFAAALLLSPVLRAQTNNGGTIEGRVSSGSTGGYLSNVQITIEGSSRETLTDGDGAYRLSGVSSGDVRVRATYLGLGGKTEQVKVLPGQTAQVNFELSRVDASSTAVTVMEKVAVVADREMSAQALALNEQRHAPNIKHVVAYDEYPSDGKNNIGEFLKFLPGVAISFSGISPTDVSVRGMPGFTTPVMIDGANVPSTTAGESRNVAIGNIPMINISRIEVTKVPTPDMPAQSLGGSVNIISKSGFERSKPLFTYSLYSSFRADVSPTLGKRVGPTPTLNNKRLIGPSGELAYTHPFNKSLSITLGASFFYQNVSQEQAATNWDLVQLIQTQSFWQTTPQLQKDANYTLGVDWKLGKHVFNLSGQQRVREGAGAGTHSLIANYGAGATGGPSFTYGAATGVGNMTMSHSALQIDTDTSLLKFRHKYSDRNWTVSMNASFSVSHADRIAPGHFTSVASSIPNAIVRGDGIQPESKKDMHAIVPATLTVRDRTGNLVDFHNGNNYVITSANHGEFFYRRENSQYKFDVKREFDAKVPFSLMAGAAVFREKFVSESYNKTYNFRTGTTNEVRLAGNYDLIDREFSNVNYVSDILGGRVQWISPTKAWNLFKSNPEYFILDEAGLYSNNVTGSKKLSETVTAGYIRGDLKLFQNRLSIVTGVRYELTQDEGLGPINDPTAILLKDANGNLVRTPTGGTITITTNVLEQNKLRFIKHGAKADRDYDAFYPSLNASYTLTDNLVARFGYARTIGRPNTNFIIPGVTYSAATANPQTITVQNAGLEPWTGDNYDLALESYFVKGGFGSFGLFKKTLKNFFTQEVLEGTPERLELYGVEPVSDDINYQILTRGNGSDANIEGFETSYKQSLTFLPHWARGLQVYVNYTKLSVKGSSTSDFTGFNPETFSYGITLARPRFVIKFNMAVQGETRRSPVAASAVIPADTYVWQGAKKRPEISGEFRFTRHFAIFGGVKDFNGGFTDNQGRYVAGSTPDYAKPNRLQEWGVYATLGVKGEF